MPFLEDAAPSGLEYQSPYRVETSAGGSAPFNRLFAAAMAQDNSAGSLTNYLATRPQSPYDATFDPFKSIQGYEDHAASFSDANSDDDVYRIKSRIDTERERRDLLESSGGMGALAQIAAGVFDPINLVPVGGELLAVARGTRALEGAFQVGRAGLLATTAQEALLHQTQETRTLGESARNVASATLLSGILGGVLGAATKAELPALSKGVTADSETFAREYGGSVGGSVGAAARQDTTLEQETLKSAGGLEKALSATSPTLRLANSPSIESRRIAQQLADQPLEFKKNAEGIETTVSTEARMKIWQGSLDEALTKADDAFVEYRMGKDRKTGDLLRIGATDLFGGDAGKLPRDQFFEEVGRAMRRNDESDIPGVSKAAKIFRETVFDPLKDQAIKLGLLPEDVSVETADSYLTRVYNVNKITARRPEFEQRITDWLGGIKDNVEERVAGFQQTLATSRARKAALETDLPARQAELQTAGPEADKAARDFATVDRQLKETDRAHRQAFMAQEQAAQRAERFKPTAPLSKDDPLAEVLRDIRKPPKEPIRLAQFVVNGGGLKDTGGEVSNLLGSHKTRPGLLNDTKGQSLDDVALKAWEVGYFPDHTERPTPDDLISALRDDINGKAKHLSEDDAAVERIAYLKDVEQQLSEAGIDVHKMSDAEVAARIRAVEQGQPAKFREATPAARARAREIEFQTRTREPETERLAERIKTLQAEWDRLKAASEESSTRARALKAETEAMQNELDRHTGVVERMGKRVDEERAFAGADKAEIQDIARQITDQLISASPARTFYTPVPLVRGPLRERTLNIPDKMIEDFLESDVQRIAKIYTRTMAADVELSRAFGKPTMETQLDKIREHYAVLRKGLEPTPAAEQKTTVFKTAKGSKYEVHADGTTTRDKAFRPEHGAAEQGPQPRSEKTFYVSAEDAVKLGEFQTQGSDAKIIAPLGDGRWGVKFTSGPNSGKFEARTVVAGKTEPAIGLTPVETWNAGAKVHFGNEITEVTRVRQGATAGEAAAKLTGKEFGEYKTRGELARSVYDWAMKNLRGKTIKNTATGWDIKIVRASIGKVVSGKGEDILKAIRAVPEMLAKGRVVGTQAATNADGNIKAFHTIVATVDIGGSSHDMALIVREMHDGRFFYDMRRDSGERAGNPEGQAAGGAEVSPGRPALEGAPGKLNISEAGTSGKADTEKKLLKFDKQMRSDLRDMAAIRDRLRGTYALPDNPNGLAMRTFRVVKDLNYLRLMGGMTVSSLSDAGRVVMTHGILRTFSDGIVPLVKNLQLARLSMKETKLAGTALDMTLDTRAMSMADVLDDYGRYSKFERGLQNVTGKFGFVSLMAPWNTWWKQFTGLISQTRTLEAIEAMGRNTITPAEKTRLASLGISPEMAERIDGLYRRHGKEENGIRWANTAQWDDHEAATIYRAALNKEVDTTIVQPGQEKPLWMSKPMGQMLGQFKSFNMVSVQRIAMAGLQKRDMATLNGAIMMVGLGMLTYYLKTPQAQLKPNPGIWVREGLDRSGLTGWLFDAHNMIEKSTRGAVGLSRLTGGPQMSRYASRGILESLLGPTAGFINDSSQIIGSAATGDWTEADSHAVRRMLPTQNLIGWKHLFDAAETGINDSFGIPQKAR